MNRPFLAILSLGLVACSGALTASAQTNYISYQFSTFAGVSAGSADGVGSAARFNRPFGVTVDSAGNVYVADTNNHTIRAIAPNGTVTTLAGLPLTPGGADGTGSAARFNDPDGMAVDSAGNVYVGDTVNHVIRQITPAGVVTTLAGLAGNLGSADGTGSDARFNFPSGVAVDGAGNVYVADSLNYTVRKITPAGVVSTLAGLAGTPGSTDGTGKTARFDYPAGVTVDSSGNIYVTDYRNHTVRKITAAGVVSTVAGLAGNLGSADGTGTAARFAHPDGVTIDGSGNVYVADSSNHTVRMITPDGVVSTVAGLAGSAGSVDGAGGAARFRSPEGVTADGAGNLYVADTSNWTIRKITPAGLVSTLAGLAAGPGSEDGVASEARFFGPTGVALDAGGNLYVVDQGNDTIRKITSDGVVTTLAGLAGSTGSADGTGSEARFNLPIGVAADNAGNLYVADTLNYTVRKITPAGVVSTLAGLAGVAGSADGTGSAARFYRLHCVAVDSAANVYVADTSNRNIRKITPEGVVTTLAGCSTELCGPNNGGSADGTGTAARFSFPIGLVVDNAGNVYVADIYNRTIRKITPAGVVTTFAGLAGVAGNADGAGSAARFNDPQGVGLDGAGNLFVADTANNTIRKITPAGVVSTVGGLAGSFGNVDGIGSAARFHEPEAVVVDGAGNLYVADEFNHTIRIGREPPQPQIALALQNEHILLTGHASPNAAVEISATAELVSPFLSLATVTADGVGNFQFEDTGSAAFTSRFYRASVPTPSTASGKSKRSVTR